MAFQKPSIPKGTRDFSPSEMVKRNYIFDTLKSVFQKYGYQPIETPAMENLDTLMGKYGDEGDKLLFRIFNSGNFLNKFSIGNFDDEERSKFINELKNLALEINKIGNLENSDVFQEGYSSPDLLEWVKSIKIENLLSSSALVKNISEKGLRYDLTVPFARYVVQNRNEITFPFKRYQIQPVWRADRPQKGRYREFYQCDVDVIGSNSLVNEAELIRIIDEAFDSLKIEATVKLNNRKILAGLADYIGYPEKITDLTIAVDKIEKIGLDNVVSELSEKGIAKDSIEKLIPVLELKGTNESKINFLGTLIGSSVNGMKGIEEMVAIFKYLDEYGIRLKTEFDLSLARGLNYYTGAIIEVKANGVQIGSICGGGRYDDLTGIFGLPNVSGVGISFGADRIFDVMNQLNLFPERGSATTRILFVNFGEKEMFYCLNLVRKIRDTGISAELYPDNAKLKKQMEYANAKKIPFVALIGENEIKDNILTIRDMISGIETKMTLEKLIERLKK